MPRVFRETSRCICYPIGSRGGSDITAAHMTALIDLRKEDLPQSDADKIRIPGEFALLKQKFGSGWNVLMGTPESIPGEAECQRAMAAAKALLYYGHGRFVIRVALGSCQC